MKILFAASEVLPFSSSGGLGDVIGSLPKALKKRYEDYDVRVISPLYSAVKEEYRRKMKKEKEFQVKLNWRKQYCAIYSLESDGVIYYFVDNEYYFKRASLYGSYDDGERFSYFCSAILTFMDQLDFFPDVMNCNDWQTALAVIQLKTKYAIDRRYASVKTVFSIHNILFQGQYDHAVSGDVFDLDPRYYEIYDYNGQINLMKGAIVCSDKVVTVSERYAKEIMTPEFANGLDPIIRMYSCKLSGILNGIDYAYYDPHTDKALYKNYTFRSVKRKAENKVALQAEIGLPVRADVPMISMISRLTDQKGLDLLHERAEELLYDDVQLVILGTGDRYYEDFFRSLQYRYNDKVRAIIAYDKELSKRIYASSDIFLMPSKTEPCGLSQMIASRYGAVPVVRETGGLYDSIKPYHTEDGRHVGNGFTFASYNSGDMLYVIREALALYQNKEEFTALAEKIMKHDFSWSVSAEKYAQLYNSVE